MKFSKVLWVFNILLVVFCLYIVTPKINMEIWGKQIDFRSLDLSNVCLGENKYCIPKFHFGNSRDFSNQIKYKYEFSGLAESVELKNKDEVFDSNMRIIQKRLEITGIKDYKLQTIKRPDYYGFEVVIPESAQNYTYALSTITTAGDIEIYQDDPNYRPSENIDQETFSLKDGKIKSDLLSIEDVESVSYYFQPAVGSTQADRKGGFVLKLDFGAPKASSVVQAGATLNSQALSPGIQLYAQNGMFPIASQAELINTQLTTGGRGQSHIVFTDLGGGQDKTDIKAIASLIRTNPITAVVQSKGMETVSSEFTPQEVNITKVAIVGAVIAVLLALVVVFKKTGLLVASNLGLVLLFGTAIAKSPLSGTSMVNSGLIFAIITTIVITLFLSVDVLQLKTIAISDFDNYTKKMRNIALSVFGIICVTYVCMMLISNATLIDMSFRLGYSIQTVMVYMLVQVLVAQASIPLLQNVFVQRSK